MFRNNFVRFILVFSLAFSILFITFSADIAVGQEELFSEVKGKMAGVSEKEKETLAKLFEQAQKIEETEDKVALTAKEIEKADAAIEALKKVIARDEANYGKERESLKLVLQCYQRMGPGSYLEIILKSDSLPDLLARINTLRDLTHNTGKLMDSITRDRQKQSLEKQKLSKELALVQEKQQRQAQTLADEKKLKQDMEDFLASLAKERQHYQDYLDDLQQGWNDLKPLFSDTSKKFAEFFEKTSFPDDAMKISFNFFSISVSIDQNTINELIASNPELGSMTFTFLDGKARIDFPDKNLTLIGKFNVIDGKRLEFEAEQGSFFGMPLDKASLKKLMEGNELELDIESKLEGSTVKAVDTSDGCLVLTL